MTSNAAQPTMMRQEQQPLRDGAAVVRRVLIANRGEVVIRIAATLRFLGIESAAIYTTPDAGAAFTTATDVALCIGDSKNYLNIGVVVGAAKRLGCDAVHPGYGFLAENAAFADAVANAGIAFLGPPASVIRSLGSKAGAKQLIAQRAPSVAVIPGYIHPTGQPPLTVAEWRSNAVAIGFPVLIKAAAGGGGKGMRVVRDESQFALSLDAVTTEATGAFGDSTIILEKYFDDVRHVEVQILGDAHGNVRHLFERECSVQRRHQKLLEECPAASLDATLRAKICDAAVSVGRAAEYRSAGTVEFIVDEATKSFYFLEVNTRLQVEHAVTELCTGFDIVAAQVFIARGLPLSDALAASQRRSAVYGSVLPANRGDFPTATRGYAIEARVYAEDSTFAPAVGTVTALVESTAAEYHTTVAPGTTVGVHYDGLLTKVIAYSTASRSAAIDALVAALRRTVIFGVQQTNKKALIHLLQHPRISSGAMATNLLDNGTINAAYLTAPLPSRAMVAAGVTIPQDIAAAAVASQYYDLWLAQRRPAGPWRRAPTSWCNNGGRLGGVAPRLLVPSHSQDSTYRITTAEVSSPQQTVAFAPSADAPFGDGHTVYVAVSRATGGAPIGVVVHPQCAQSLEWCRVTYFTSANPSEPIFDEFAAVQMTAADQALWGDDPKRPVLSIVHVHLMESGNAFSFGVVDVHAGNAAVSRPPTGSLLPAVYTMAASNALSSKAGGEEDAVARDGPAAANSVAVRAPIPAKVVRVQAASGTSVEKDAVVVVLESMKMETKLLAPAAGVVRVVVKAGDMVQSGKIVFTIATTP